MGYNLALNLKNHHQVVAFDINRENIDQITTEGVTPAFSIAELSQKLEGRKVIRIMVPAGEAVDEEQDNFSDKVVVALRNEFEDHTV